MSPTINQQLNEKLRDAQLAFYLTHAVPQDPKLQELEQVEKLKTADDLYSYWLMDVQVSQAVPTTHVACAISSVQQYINGISLGLEPGYETEGMSQTQLETWHGRLSTYSLWHASQQLRYFPSSFLNPELRINKTENFKKIENDINQCRIQSSTILSAVQNYLNRFEDIANLTTLNGYIDGNINEMAESTYYFVAKSRAEKTYYWRSLAMAKRALRPQQKGQLASKQDMPEASAWSDWEKIPLPASETIPDRSVRPVSFNNRLFIIWAQVIRPTPSFNNITQYSPVEETENELDHKARLELDRKSKYSKISLHYIYKKYDGSWSMPCVCSDEYCVLAMGSEEIIDATTTIATLDSTTQPASLFLGISIKKNLAAAASFVTDIKRDFYQAVRLDLQFDIERLYSVGSIEDYFAYPQQFEVAKRYFSIFSEHNPSNFNFHAPASQIAQIKEFKNTSPHTTLNYWNYEKKQNHIKDFTNTGDLTFNTTTCALEVKSTLMIDFPKHQTLSFTARSVSFELRIKLIVIFNTEYPKYINLAKGSVVELTNAHSDNLSLRNLSFTDSATNLTLSDFVKHADSHDALNLPMNVEDKHATVSLEGCQIDLTVFTHLFSAHKTAYSISLGVTSGEAINSFTFENVEPSALERTYKHIVLIPLDRETPNPPNIYRANTLILGESGASRRYLPNTSPELKAEQSITAQINLDPSSLRPYGELKSSSLTSPTHAQLTLLHGVVILEIDLSDSTSYLRGYALKALTVTLDKNAKTIIPIAPRVKRIASKSHGMIECIDFSESMIQHSDSPDQLKARAPIRMNTCFVATLTKAASVSLDKVFTLTPEAGLEPALTEGDPDQPLDFHGAHGKYYWELFLYLPWLVAYRLNLEQRYAEAQTWLHYLFEPRGETDADNKAADCWKLKVLLVPVKELSYARDNPYDPNQIALSAPIHFRKALYKLYLDILINRGDAAYRQLSPDSLTEAKLWYVRAKRLLGLRPTPTTIDPWAAITLEKLSTTPSNELRKLEARMSQEQSALAILSRFPTSDNQAALTTDTPYLRRPLNPGLMTRWDKVESRLHNLRHHLDLSGKPLQLAAYATPLSPHLLLARAVQGGGKGSAAALSSQQGMVGHYRFQVMQAQAMIAVDNLIQFGNTLLSLLERKEQTEHISLQQAHAWDLSALVVEQQAQMLLVDDNNQAALLAGRRMVEGRVQYFEKQLQEGINPGESRATQEHQASAALETGAYAAQAAAGLVMMYPNIFGTSSGGMRMEGAMHAVQATIQGAAHIKRSNAFHLDRTEQFNRRNQEWAFALEQAKLELSQIDAQLKAYTQHNRVTRVQLVHTQTALAQAKATYEILSKRFCSAQLYQWLNGQFSTFYFQAYDMTHSLCVAAQACWQYERADWNRTFIQNTLWNNQYKGLAAGEALKLNLLQMNAAYLKNHSRALEISKTVSLRGLYAKDNKTLENVQAQNPQSTNATKEATKNKEWAQLQAQLKAQGTVDFELTQALFDADYPGHYQRRIKSISVSLPATLGPYEDIRATLTQTYNMIQFSEKPEDKIENLHVNEQIALSTGLNDNGLFTLNFDNDERYLPFEYTGVVSRWQLAFPNHNDQTSLLDSLTDIIVHVRYTAKSVGGSA
ncbi:neuraminidase-like domain-containing protein [Pseudomonas sp. SIMBA_077]